MRILVATNLYPPHYIGGYELRCRDIVEGLVKRGHDVYVLTSNYGVGRNVVEENVYRCLPVFIYEYTKIPSDGIPRQFLKAARAILEIRRLIRKLNIDLIYISKVQGFQEPVIATLANSGIPVVWDISDLWLTTYGEGPWFSYWKKEPDHRWLNKPKAVVRSIVSKIVPTTFGQMEFNRGCYTSRFLRDYYEGRGLPVNDAGVIHCGCPEMFFCDSDKEASGVPFRFLYAGQFVEGKGVHTILEAAGRLMRVRPELEFTIDLIGDGIPEYMERLDRLVVENRLQQRIRFIGKVTRETMPETYRKYDGLIFSSIWEEAFALTLLESMASGVPVVSTATGGNCEIIKDGDVGLEYEPGNSIHLAYQMEKLMSNPGLWRHLRANGKNIVSRQFTVSHMVGAVEEYLKKTLRLTASHHEYPSHAAGNIIEDRARC